MNIFHILNISSKKGKIFLKYQLLAVIIFAFLYWFQDWIISHYPEFSKKYFFSTNNGPPPDLFIYYLWYSLITQTTVGYGGVIAADGSNEAFTKIKSVPYKILNISQLISVFIITALSM